MIVLFAFPCYDSSSNANNDFQAEGNVRGESMAVCYKKLWKMLIDKDMIKKDLRLQTGFSTTTMSKLSKDENVSMDVIEKICTVLNCDVGDIMEFVPDKKEEQ